MYHCGMEFCLCLYVFVASLALSKETEFLVVVSYYDTSIFVSQKGYGQVTVSIPRKNITQEYQLTNSTSVIPIPSGANIGYGIEDKAVAVNTSAEASVVVFSRYMGSGLILPCTALGTEYIIVIGQKRNSYGYIYIATAENNTDIIITFRSMARVYFGTRWKCRQSLQVTLQAYQTFVLFFEEDEDNITGSEVTSNKPVAVFTWQYHYSYSGFTQLIPTPSLGKQFIVPFLPVYTYQVVRVVAVCSNITTRLMVNNRTGELTRGEFYDVHMNDSRGVYINSTSPVIVVVMDIASYSEKTSLIPSTEQYLNTYYIQSRINLTRNMNISIIIERSKIESFLYGYTKIIPASFVWENISDTNYVVGTVSVDNENIVELTASAKFGLLVWGEFRAGYTYVYPGGLDLSVPYKQPCYNEDEGYTSTGILQSTTTTPTTTQSIPQCTPQSALGQVGLGEDCGTSISTTALCQEENSACNPVESNRRKCGCIRNYVKTRSNQCKKAPSKLVRERAKAFMISTSTPLDTEVGRLMVNISSEWDIHDITSTVIPDTGILKSNVETNDIVLKTNKTIPETHRKYFIVQVAVRIDYLTIADTIPVIVEISRSQKSYTPPKIYLLLVEGTRQEALVADIRSLDYDFRGDNYDYNLGGNEIANRLFKMDDGKIRCRQRIQLKNISMDVVAFEVVFNISGTNRDSSFSSSPVLLAEYHVLIVKNFYEFSFFENEESTIMKFITRSDNFIFSSKNLPNDIFALQNDSVGVIKQPDFDAGQQEFNFDIDVVTTNNLFTTISVLVRVKDANDERPKFTKLTYDVTILAGSLANTLITTLSATDADTVGKLSYRVLGDYQNKFQVDPETGVVKSLVKLERKTFGSAFFFSVRVYDGRQYSTNTANISVTLLTVLQDDNIDNIFITDVMEESNPGTNVTSVCVQNFTNYIFLTNFPKTLFTINETTGLIRTKKQLDRENSAESFTVFDVGAYRKDEDQCFPTVLGSLETTLIDINDNAPIFTKPRYTGRIPEGSAVGTEVKLDAILHADDKDIGGNSKLVFRLSGAGNNLFDINGESDAKVTVAGTLDRESRDKHNLKVIVIDGVIPANRNTSSVSLDIIVEDVNDNEPVYVKNSYSFTIKENEAARDIGTVNAIDEDIGPNGEVSYLIVSGGLGYFQVGHRDGLIRTTTQIDRESYSAFNLTISAYDAGNPILRRSTIVLVMVEDENDNSPVFNNIPDDKKTVKEDQNCSVTILTAEAKDLDAGENGRVTYSTPSTLFTINPTSGELKCVTSLDYETSKIHLVELVATDHGTPPRNTSITVDIQVLDVNDNYPQFSARSYSARFTDLKMIAGKPMIVIDVSDADAGRNGQVTLTLTGTNSQMFTINNAGVVRVNIPSTTTATFQFTVTATDGGTPSLSNSTSLTIEKNQAILFQTSTATPAKSPTQRLTQSPILAQSSRPIWNSVVNQVFAADNNFHKVASETENFEQIDGLPLNVYQDSSLKSTQSLIKTLTRGVKFSNTDYFFSVVENTDHSVTKLGTIKANVTSATTVVYSLLEAFSQNIFRIDRSTGDLFCDKILDREKQSMYSTVVRAYQDGVLSNGDVAVIHINVTDVNDNSPLFTVDQNALLFEIPEDQSPGTLVTTLTAIDPDEGVSADVRYSLFPSSYPFAIDSKAGMVTVRNSLDRNITSVYMISVTASDQGSPPKSSTISMTIDVLDVNDNAPVFNQSSYIANVGENQLLHTEVLNVLATDEDDPDNNGKVSYVKEMSLVDSPGATCPFKVDNFESGGNVLGQITLNEALDFESVKEYICEVVTYDSPNTEDGRHYVNTTVTFRIEDYNDNRPKFHGAPYRANVSRYANAGSSLMFAQSISVTDADSGINSYATFSIEPTDYFVVDPVSGQVMVQSRLVSVSVDKIALTLTAKDQGTPSLSSVTQVIVTIVDNNTRPWFIKPEYKVEITEENEPDGSTLIQVEARDIKEGREYPCNCTYRLVPDKEGFTKMFSIGKTSGILKQLDSIDREKAGSYINLMVEAVDGGIPPKSANAMIEIHVIDINDNRPYFQRLTQRFRVNQSAETNHYIGTLAYRDDDEGDNAMAVFAADEKRIQVDRTSGKLFVKSSLATGSMDPYDIQFQVTATDSKPVVRGRGDLSQNAVLVIITVVYFNPNKAPKFSQDQYKVGLPFWATKGYKLKNTNFGASDEDGDKIMYAIVSGNKRDTFSIDSSNGSITLSYGLDSSVTDSTVGNKIALNISATDDAILPKTGYCTVVIEILEPETRRCLAESRVQSLESDSQQYQIFLILFGIITALLAVVIGMLIFTCYKWRMVAGNRNVPTQNNQGRKSSETAPYTGLQPNAGLANMNSGSELGEDYTTLRTSEKDFTTEVKNPAYTTYQGIAKVDMPYEPLPDYDGASPRDDNGREDINGASDRRSGSPQIEKSFELLPDYDEGSLKDVNVRENIIGAPVGEVDQMNISRDLSSEIV